MSLAAAYLAEHGHAVGIDGSDVGRRWATIEVTPRYRTSAHVVFLLVDRRSARPRLVLKAARYAEGDASLIREAECLRSIQDARPGGFDSIPRVLDCREFNGTRILLETGLSGRPLTDAIVRRRFAVCRDAVTTWVEDLHRAANRPAIPGDENGYRRHAAAPLGILEQVLADRDGEVLARARGLLDPLKDGPLPRVFEHGDLSAPNLLLDERGSLQVVDWELASRDGPPACDLFFALSYLALAGNRRGGHNAVGAFHAAFYGADAWATPLVRHYQSVLDLEDDMVSSLFILCWIRYVARLVTRLPGAEAGAGRPEPTSWLTDNRYFQILKHALLHHEKLFAWTGRSGALT